MKCAKTVSYTHLNARDRLIMVFLTTTGCMLNELVEVKWKDLIVDDKDNYYIRPVSYTHLQLHFNLQTDSKKGDVSNITSKYKKPSIKCLKNYNIGKNGYKEQNKSAAVKETLKNFNIEIDSCLATFGPTITRYEVSPKPGTKVSKIVNLSDDLALSLAARSIRIEAPVPGKSVIGIEVPNDKPQVVGLKEVITSEEFLNNPSSLAVGLGKEISGKPLIADLAKMPHLLVAGATGSGTSVCIKDVYKRQAYILKNRTQDTMNLLDLAQNNQPYTMGTLKNLSLIHI